MKTKTKSLLIKLAIIIAAVAFIHYAVMFLTWFTIQFEAIRY